MSILRDHPGQARPHVHALCSSSDFPRWVNEAHGAECGFLSLRCDLTCHRIAVLFHQCVSWFAVEIITRYTNALLLRALLPESDCFTQL